MPRPVRRPFLVRLGRSGKGADLGVTHTVIAFGCGFGAVAGLTGLALGPWLVERVLGTRYAPAGLLLGPALWLVVPYACGAALTSLALVRGHIRTAVIASAGAALVLAAASPPLTARWDRAGMLAATGFALACWVSVLVARGVGNVRSSVLRPAGWVGLALASYLVLASVHALVGLVVGLTTLWWSASRFGIATRDDIRGIGRWFRTDGVRDTVDVHQDRAL